MIKSRSIKTLFARLHLFRQAATGLLIFFIGLLSVFLVGRISAHTSPLPQSPTSFRIGEKLSYNVSFGKFQNAGYIETSVVSRGKLSGRDAVELRSKVKTLDIVSAAFVLLDESRTVYAAPDTGLPLYISKDMHASAIPKQAVSNYLSVPTTNYDLLTLIYKARESGGAGSFPMFEDEKLYNVTFQPTVVEHIKSAIGEFDTTVSLVQSDFLAANGIKELKINFTNDEDRVPVLIRVKTAKGEFRAIISSINLPEPPPAPTPTPTPTPKSAVTPKPTPKLTPTPEEYVENRPLLPELGFEIGEILEYQISSLGKPVATITFNARERKLVKKEDSLLLAATISGVEQESNLFRLGDSANVQVDPDTLAPKSMEAKFDSAFIGLNQTLTFDKRTGDISFGGKQSYDAPIGTHTVLSLIYAMRSFNLRPSKDPANPVNDTRVAVFWESKAYIFTLRPSNPEEIMVNSEKVSAQLVTINTGIPKLDSLNLKVWLGTDSRIPLRFSFGAYQADLISQSNDLRN